MKNLTIIKYITSLVALAIIMYSCASTNQFAQDKSGAVLWGENCMRCHSNPSPVDFSDKEWQTIGLHMEIRANLTHDEATKIVEFMKSAN